MDYPIFLASKLYNLLLVFIFTLRIIDDIFFSALWIFIKDNVDVNYSLMLMLNSAIYGYISISLYI